MLTSPIDEIKNRLDIIDLVKEYVKLEKAGINYRGLCPFHSEKTPSFFVSPSRQRWHCFGSCSEGGDIFTFIMKIEGVEFPDALRILAAKTGVELKKQDPRVMSERQRVYEICELATRFFEEQIKRYPEVRDYLNKRGIEEADIKEWRIGYAPDNWEDLAIFLKNKGYKSEELDKSGLFGRKEGSSRHYNRFRGRIIFPVFDFNSQPIGFGGRIFKDDNKKEAKYLNTPNTILYNKSRVLYGLHRARNEIRKSDFCILTEGYTDVIMSHKTGLANTVSSSGTALTEEQLAIVRRYTDNLTTAFDMDDAGGSATTKGIDLAIAQNFNVKVAILPTGLDPADIILRNKSEWLEAINNSVSIMEFYFKRAFADRDPFLPEDKKKIAADLLPRIAIIPNDIEKASWAQRLAREIGVREEDIISELKKVKAGATYPQETIEKKARRDRENLIEERLLMIIAVKPKLLESFSKEDLLSEEGRKMVEMMRTGRVGPKEKERLDYLAMKIESEGAEDDIIKEFDQCLEELNIIISKRRLKEIGQKIREAEAKKDSKEVEELTKEFNLISQSLGSR